MSNTIDQRVVEMRFDNSNFESNVKTSLNSLKNLDSSISNMSSSNAKSFESLSNVANKLDFSGLTSSVESISSKFTTLGIIGVTALQNIANRAIDVGITLAKSLSVDQISQGYNEYELKMGSIQTIMASTGEELKTVKNYLEELNTYADKTIYSFSDMTNNIGKFTNAGVDLDTSVKAIQGISNWAAISGANANEASRAMYNLSQSIAGGYVQLIDWKSVKFANMATQDVMKNIAETAVAMGTLKKNSDDTYESITTNNKGAAMEASSLMEAFNSGLQYQWLTTDVLMEAMSHYSTDVRAMSAAEKEAYETKLKGIGYTEEQIAAIEKLGSDATDAATVVKTFTQLLDTLREAVGSGWAMTFEYIIGDFEQAKQMWTAVNHEISSLIDKQSDERNKLIGAWSEGGGRDALIKSFSNIWQTVKSVAGSVRKAFRDIFPKTTAKDLIQMTKNFQAMTYRIKEFVENSKTMTKIKNNFRMVFQVINNLKHTFESTFKTAKGLILVFKSALNELFPGDFFSKTFKALGYILNFSTAIRTGAENIRKFLLSSENIGKLKDIFKGVLSVVDLFGKAIKSVFNIIRSIVSPILGLTESIGTSLLDIGARIGRFFTDLNAGTTTIQSFEDLVNRITSIVSALKVTVSEIFSSNSVNLDKIFEAWAGAGVGESAAKHIAGVVNNIKGAFNDIKNALLNGDFSGIKDRIKGIFDSISDAFSNFKPRFKFDTGNLGEGLLSKLASIRDKIFEILSNITDAFIQTNIFSTLITIINNLLSVFGNLAAAFNSALLFVKAFFDGLSDSMSSSPLMTLSAIFQGITKVIDSLNATQLVVYGKNFAEFLDNIGDAMDGFKFEKYGKALKDLAIGVALIVGSLVVLTTLDSDDLTVALLGIINIVLALSAALIAIDKISGNSIRSSIALSQLSTSLIKLSVAVFILAAAAKKIGDMSGSRMAESLGVIVGLLTAMVGVGYAITKLKIKSFNKTALSLILFAEAVNILAKALVAIGSLGVENALVGVIGITAILGELIIVSKLLDSIKFSDVAGFLALAGSVWILADAVTSLALLDPVALTKGIVGVTIMLAEMLLSLKILEESNVGFSAAAGLLVLAVALRLVAGAITEMGQLTSDQLTQGFYAFIVMMASLLVYAKLLPETMLQTAAATLVMVIALNVVASAIEKLGALNFTDMLQGLVGLAGGMLILGIMCQMMSGSISGAFAMIIVAAGLVVLAEAISIIGSLSLADVAVALIGLASSLLILSVALIAMQGTIAGAAALLVASIGILAIAGALAVLGSLSIGQMLTGLIGLAAAIAIFAFASVLVTPILPLMAALAGVLLLLATSVSTVGGGLWLISEALSNLGANGSLGVTVFGELCKLITIYLVPLTAFCGVLLLFAADLLLVGAGTLVCAAGAVALAAGIVLLSVALGFAAIVGIGLAEALEIMITTLSNLIPSMVELTSALGSFCLAIVQSLPVLVSFMVTMLGLTVVLGVFSVVSGVASIAITALSAALIILSVALTVVSIALIAITTAIALLTDSMPELANSAKNMVNMFKNAANYIVDGLINGIKNGIKKVKESAANMAKSVWNGFCDFLGIHSPSKLFTEGGEYCGDGVVNGLNNSQDKVAEAGFDLGSLANSNFMDGLGELNGGDISLDPNISLDTSNISMDGDIDIDKLMEDSDLKVDASSLNMTGDMDLSNISDMQIDTSALDYQKELEAQTNQSTDALRRQNKEYKYTNELIRQDFRTNGSNFYGDVSEHELFDDWIDNLDYDQFNKFFENYNVDMEDVKKKTGGSLTDIATMFAMFQEELKKQKPGVSAGEVLVDNVIVPYLQGFGNIKQIMDDLRKQNKADNDTLLEALGFGSVKNVDAIFDDLAKSIDKTSKKVTKTTKEAVISADELEKKAKEVIAGKYGNGADRVKALGDQYAVIQNKVNELLGSNVRHETEIKVDDSSVKKTAKELDEVNSSSYEWRKKILNDYEDKIPTAVANSLKKQNSYQNQVLKNESKLPTEVANRLKEINGATESSANNIADTAGKAEEKISKINETTDEWREKIIDDYSNKIPSAVKKSIDEQISYQGKVLENESKIPTEVANKLKEINQTSRDTAKTFAEMEAETDEQLDKYVKYCQEVQKTADKLPSSVKEAVENNMNDAMEKVKSSDLKKEYSEYKAMNAAMDKDEKQRRAGAARRKSNGTAKERAAVATPSVQESTPAPVVEKATTEAADKEVTIDVTPKYNLKEVNTDEIEQQLKTALNEAVKDISISVNVEATTDFVTANTALDTFKNKVSTIKMEVPKLLNGVSNSFNTFFVSIADMITSKTKPLVSKFIGIFNEMNKGSVASIEAYLPTYLETGKRISRYLGQGIYNASNKVTSMAIAVARSAREAFVETFGLDIFSDAGESFIDELYNTLANLNIGDMNDSPVVKPVLDLSNVEGQSSTISGLLNKKANIPASIQANIDANNSRINTRDAELNKAFNTLNNRLDELSNAVTNKEPTPVNVDVTLQGDAKGLFNAVRQQSNNYTRRTGRTAF